MYFVHKFYLLIQLLNIWRIIMFFGLGMLHQTQIEQSIFKKIKSKYNLRYNNFRLNEIVRRCVGNQCAQRVSTMEKDAFPLILILIRSRGSLELLNVIEGKSTPSEVLLNLIQSHESFEQQRLRDVDEELMREKRENLKKQQEDEYEQSLQADLAKERAKQEEEYANEQLKQHRLVRIFSFKFASNLFVILETTTRIKSSFTR
jgi:hypothetical protein